MVEPRSAVELEIVRWAAWAPGLEDRDGWRAWAEGDLAIGGPVAPDVRFVDRLLRRRLGPLSRMAFRVATDCLDGAEERPLSVFCSRYGEFSRAFEILGDLARDEPVSPMSFSLSVHNTASSQFSILREDRSHSTALAAGEASLEAGFLECWTLLADDAAPSALLVYGDQVLPEAYAGQATTVAENIAAALWLRQPRDGGGGARLALSWSPSRRGTAAADGGDGSVLGLLRLLLKGGAPIELDAGRLIWTWSYDGPPA